MKVPSNDDSNPKKCTNPKPPVPAAGSDRQAPHARRHRPRARAAAARRDAGDDDDREVGDAGAGPANTTGVCPKKCERRGVYLSGADELPWWDTKALRDKCAGEASVAWTP